jgi:hypothetical protein
MNNRFRVRLSGIAVLLLFAVITARSQGNLDWEMIWFNLHPDSSNTANGWMYGSCQYTGIAYDKWRDLVYVVNPAYTGTSPLITPAPRVQILDAKTGLKKMSVGRALNGQGGQLPVPTDTVAGGFNNGQFALYKIDLDDEGRIFACNLVSPVSTSYPYKLYRWDSPTASPKRVFVSSGDLSTFRWGDAFDVVGRRVYVTPPGVWRDSVRIFASGGVYNPAGGLNNQVKIFLADTRSNPPYDYRAAITGSASNTLLASHGLAVTGSRPNAEIWMDNNTRVTTKNNQVQSGSSFPQSYTMSMNYSISSDTVMGTGPSGAIAYISHLASSKNYLVCADGLPNFPDDETSVNYHTRARLVDLTQAGTERRPTGFGDTPYFGFVNMDQSGGVSNFVADVDFKLDPDSVTGNLYVILFVMMSNNGIAAFRSRTPLYINVPVELQEFQAHLGRDGARLQWRTASETNNAGFTVERSLAHDGVWTLIGFVAGNGTTTDPHEYSYLDPLEAVSSSTRFASYRLRQTDHDGRSTLSEHVDVALDGGPSSVTLDQNYPNPAGRTTAITYRVHEPGDVRLTLCNSMGATIRALESGARNVGSYTTNVDLRSLPAGMYQYVLESAGRRICRSMTVLR